MTTISKKEQLDQEIAALQIKKNNDLMALKNQFHVVQESLNPLNLLKSTIKDVASNTTASGIIGGVASIAGDYLSTKILPRNGPLKNIGSSVLRFLVRKLLPSKTEK